MASAPPRRVSEAAPSPRPPAPEGPIIGQGCRFDGFLTFRGEAWIDGDFRGEVSARGTLGLGENARVGASVNVDELIVAGELEGDVIARERIELRSTARVRGNIEAPRIRFEDGCVLQGHCRTLSVEASQASSGENSEGAPKTPKSP